MSNIYKYIPNPDRLENCTFIVDHDNKIVWSKRFKIEPMLRYKREELMSIDRYNRFYAENCWDDWTKIKISEQELFMEII